MLRALIDGQLDGQSLAGACTGRKMKHRLRAVHVKMTVAEKRPCQRIGLSGQRDIVETISSLCVWIVERKAAVADGDALETHLRHEPEKVSRSRIKRLRALRQPQYRLRVGEVRIFYDVIGDTVEILAIVMKRDADAWLAQFGNPE